MRAVHRLQFNKMDSAKDTAEPTDRRNLLGLTSGKRQQADVLSLSWSVTFQVLRRLGSLGTLTNLFLVLIRGFDKWAVLIPSLAMNLLLDLFLMIRREGLELMPSWGPTYVTTSNAKYVPKAPPPQITNMGIGGLSFQHLNFLGEGYIQTIAHLSSQQW